ncbi:amino acid adenylation domain-containing protein [Roseateles sp. BYS96W]|uniref:Amino acid adenylation domain-containing protein n=2 Tax=Pelomonas nitida TaxID=3299027 RepID=A0ABW7GCM1_9BURK
MSIGQQGLWFLGQISGDVSAAYNVVLPLAGEVLPPADRLAAALARLISRHPLLGARVVLDRHQPCFDTRAVTMAVEEVQGELLDVAAREAVRPLDMKAGPLLRVLRVQGLDGRGEGLVLTVSHLVFDGPSADLLLEELEAALAKPQAETPSVSPYDHAAAVAAERAHVGSEASKRRLAAQAIRLATLPALALPAAAVTQDLHVYPAAHVAARWPVTFVQRVEAAANRHDATPAALYLAAFQVALWQFTGQGDLGFSIPVSRRDDEASQVGISYLTNLGVLRGQLDPEMTLAALCTQVADAMFDLLDDRHLPFPSLMQAMKAAKVDPAVLRRLIGFNYQATARRALKVDGGELVLTPMAAPHAKDRLQMGVERDEAGVLVTLEYDRAAFDAGLMQSLMRQFRRVLAVLLDKPEQPLSRLPLVSDEERAALLAQGTGEALQEGGEAVVDVYGQLVAAAKREPQALALWCEGRGLSHGALHVRAGALAQRLRELGLGSQDRVALCLPRSLAHAVAVVGALRAGVAFVPLDVQAPEARLQLQLQEVRASLVLSTPALQGRVPAQVRCLCLQEDGRLQEVPEEAPAEGAQAWEALGPAPQVHPRQLAYVLFTSGSTGRPKGVAVDVGALGSHLAACVKRYELQAQDRVLQFAASTFDTAIEQLLAPLCAGASVYLRGEAAWSPDEMMEFVKAQGLTVVDMPTAYWHLLSGEAKLAQARSLRLVVAGGEAALAARSRQAPAGVRSLNAYGPTEATVTCCMGPLAGAAAGAGPWVPIGKPLPGTQVYVLDAALNLVPQGVAGQLYVAGERVARGYLGQPGLTARQFVPDPYGEPGRRMYATGDVVRWLEGGTLEYLGRADQQLKIRGVRIEPGEIEQALSAVAGVRQSVVVAQEEADGERSLAAYVVGEAGLTGQGLREQLQGRLPQALLPTHWSFLESLPLTPHGKVDRKRLPAITVVAAPVADGAGPSTATEQLVADIWADVLRLSVPGLSCDANFYVLGGHSLLATQIVARLSERLGRPVPLRLLLEQPTVRRFAAALDATAGHVAEAPAAPPLVRRDRR